MTIVSKTIFTNIKKNLYFYIFIYTNMYGGKIGGGREYGAPLPFFSPPPTPYNPRQHTTYVTEKPTAAAKDYDAEWKRANSSEAKQRGAAAKTHAISEFKKRFPHADISRFKVQVDFDPNRKGNWEVFFPESDGSLTDPRIQDRKYWSQVMKDALGIHQDGGFPYQLSLFIQNNLKPIPAVDFSEEINKSMHIGDVLNKELKIYVTPREFFTTKFRKIFTKTQIKFTTAKYARKWLGGPDMSFWPQQLNFALWCATTGCGISRDILFSSGSLLNLSPQVRSFYLFHVYFTVRRILYELGGIESADAWPDDPPFNQKENNYNIDSYKKNLCRVRC